MAKMTNETVLQGLLTPGQVCSMFNRGELTIAHWRKTRGLPYIRIPGDSRDTIRYNATEVERWARANKVPFKVPSKTRRKRSK